MKTTTSTTNPIAQTISPAKLLEHWQGHRRLTRKVIEAFPEEEFFTYTLGGMRPFAEMVMELLAIAEAGIREIATGKREVLVEQFDHGSKKAYLLELWDKATENINELWSEIPLSRFSEITSAFGQYEATNISHVMYFIDNEVHHRGQAYVYLRSLGVEPPLFYDR